VRRTLVVLVALALALAVAATTATACTGSSSDDAKEPTTTGAAGTGRAALPASETAGLVPAKAWKARQDDYLAFATGDDLDPTSPLSLIAQGEADRRAGRTPDLSAATPADFEPIFAKLRSFADTGDFDVNRLITLYRRDHDVLDPKLAAAIKTRILAFKYWWTEPTPKGKVDSQYYWTENHQIIYLANEYVAGQTFPDEVFTNDGKTGKQHVAHAEERLRTWFAWRSRFGFSEWLSNVYWNEDMVGVLLLAEFADDPEIARLASMTLDVLLVELAGHTEKGTFGSTHGRSYQKDKLNGRDEDTFSTAKLVFDQTPVPYDKADSATLLATAGRYRPPEVVRKIAASKQTAVFRTKSSLPLDPHAAVDPKVKAPYGLSFTGEEGLMAWWGLGAQFPWQVAPTSAAAVKQYDLFKTTNFKQASGLASVVETADDATIRGLASSLATQVNPGLLSQVDTYTWRSPAVMLSTAQDWRPGQRGEQDHIWQATLDPDALVFTNHPRDDVPSKDDPNANEGYWTGDGAIPRSAQHQNVSISIYSPQYEGGDGVGSGAYAFTYLDETHAFFPTEHFDQVVQRDGWTIGRKGDGYVALWSARPTHWRTYAADEFTRGLTKPFDLVADGGPDDVWITEVAQAGDYASFDAFVSAITASKPQVSARYPCPANAACDSSPEGGATVSYRSPSQGLMTFGWTPTGGKGGLLPLTVDGKDQDLHPDGLRWDAPYAKATFDDGTYHAELGGASLDLDFTKARRRTTR